jgi:hypothetical protein
MLADMQDAEVPDLAQLLCSSSAKVQDEVPTAPGQMASKREDYQHAVAQAGGIQQLVLLLGGSSAEVQEEAAAALGRLVDSGNSTNQQDVLQAGAIQPLVELLGSSSAKVQEWAATELARMAQDDSSKQQAVAQAGAIPVLVRLLGSSSANVQQWAAAALGHLALNNSSNQQAIAQAGAVLPLAPVQLPVSSGAEVREQAAEETGQSQHRMSTGDQSGCLERPQGVITGRQGTGAPQLEHGINNPLQQQQQQPRLSEVGQDQVGPRSTDGPKAVAACRAWFGELSSILEAWLFLLLALRPPLLNLASR